MVSQPDILPVLQSDRLVLRGLPSQPLLQSLNYVGPSESSYARQVNPATSDEARDSFAEISGVIGSDDAPWLQFVIELSSERKAIGNCAIRPLADTPGTGEIRHAIFPEYQRSGFGTEAVRSLIEFAFTNLELRRIVAITDTQNAAASRIATRIGMTREERRHVGSSEPWDDDFLYSIAQREWLKTGVEVGPHHERSNSAQT